jgi:hypothetical protein
MKLSLKFAVCGLAVLCAVCMLNIESFAQNKNTAEMSGFIGLLHSNAPKGAKDGATGVAFSGGGGYFVVDNLKLQADLAIGYTSKNNDGTTSVDFAFGPEYVFPVNNDKIKPYVRVDIDIVHAVQVTKPGFGFGGGLRFATGSNWGIKPEFRLVKAVDLPASLMFGMGIYYNFGK